MVGCRERFSSHAQEGGITFALYKTKEFPKNCITEYCLELSSLSFQQGSSFFSVQQAIKCGGFFFSEERNFCYWNNQVAMFPCQNLFAFPAFLHRLTKSTHFAYLFQPSHKAHKTRAIWSQGNNRFVQARSSSHSAKRRHSLADMVL